MNRGILLLCVSGILLFTTTGSALAAEDDGVLRGMWKLIMSAIESCGDQTNIGGNSEPIGIDGTGNTLIQIENMEIVITTGNIESSSPYNERDGEMEIIHRLMDQFASSQHPSWQKPPQIQFPDGFKHNPPNLLPQLEHAPPMHDPELFKLMMRIGKLASTDPEFREKLEQLVDEARSE